MVAVAVLVVADIVVVVGVVVVGVVVVIGFVVTIEVVDSGNSNSDKCSCYRRTTYVFRGWLQKVDAWC